MMLRSDDQSAFPAAGPHLGRSFASEALESMEGGDNWMPYVAVGW